MKRTRNSKIKLKFYNNEFIKEIAFHEAGHAAAIYFGNKQKGLPAIDFRIHINPLTTAFNLSEPADAQPKNYAAKVEGGRLIPILPSTHAKWTNQNLAAEMPLAEHVFEADIVNFLSGALAEAKYVSQRDGEQINHWLVNLNSLKFYGGLSDLQIINDYLNCFLDSSELREIKVSELIRAAYNFINDSKNWSTISGLAEHIMTAEKHIIEYDEIIDVLEQGSQNFKMLKLPLDMGYRILWSH
ncbi:MAG: hypothetical protein ABSB19_03290 [Methylomonas sp.]|jgi:hypothetical protein